MGLWASLKSGIKKVANKVANTARSVVNYAKEKADVVRTKVTNTWNTFTGKNTYNEAKALYDKIKTTYEKKKKEFDTMLASYLSSIEKHVTAINAARQLIKNNLFKSFAEDLRRITGVEETYHFAIDSFTYDAPSLTGIKARKEVFKIDFDKDKIKTTIQAVFTLGFWTRKRAKETLLAVKEQEKVVNDEIAKMDGTIRKLKMIDKSLDNIEYYFESLISIYTRILDRVNHAVNGLYVRCLIKAHKVVGSEMLVAHLPKVHQEELQAAITATKILKVMAEKPLLVDIDHSDNIEKFNKDVMQAQSNIDEQCQAA